MKENKNLAIAFAASKQMRKRASSPATAITPGASSELSSDTEEHYSSIADAILAKKRKALDAMPQHDMADMDMNAEETPANPSPYDDQNEEAGEGENYDLDQISPQPRDSNQKGDRVSAIMRKRKK